MCPWNTTLKGHLISVQGEYFDHTDWSRQLCDSIAVQLDSVIHSRNVVEHLLCTYADVQGHTQIYLHSPLDAAYSLVAWYDEYATAITAAESCA